MNDDRLDRYTLIGLHKMAAHCGDGLVSELYELLARRGREMDETNIAEFPVRRTRAPLKRGFDIAPLAQDNILAFPGTTESRVVRKADRR